MQTWMHSESTDEGAKQRSASQHYESPEREKTGEPKGAIRKCNQTSQWMLFSFPETVDSGDGRNS